MTQEFRALIIAAASIGFFHTLLGPDHYLPFIMMSWARRWSTSRTAVITLLCALGHIAGSVVLGLVGVAEGHDKVLADPAPWTGVTGLLDSAVQITLQAWVNSEDWWQTQADLMQGGKEALDAAGIEIPFPHQVAVPYGDEDVMPVVRVRTVEDGGHDVKVKTR